ncbi:hypothetical protein [Larkinella terrae]|uniref:TFIIB-type zinc ribbon-containing protein n=1 Tax=Larkinella terrae TaxID=2025311 RepID=A0A7K0ETS7_9BACT|nr:hypothetical protein [Larkinella terrae]MRS65214.1 hypothetical protein [Larkinella terrae]
MENETIRYAGPATTLYAYANEFLVECPKCQHLAVVTTNRSRETSQDKLTCFHCNHSEKADDRIRYTATVKWACDHCNESLDFTIPNNKEKVEELIVSCPHCGTSQTVKPKNDSYRLRYKNSGIGDPVFNLPLWFQTEIKGDFFWAFNRDHLIEIRNYVSAKLRERQTPKYTTMVEKLPHFIKSAKNRDAILKAIEKLLRK